MTLFLSVPLAVVAALFLALALVAELQKLR